MSYPSPMCLHIHHHSEKLDADFWSVAGEEPGMDLLKFVDSPKSISQGIRAHHHGHGKMAGRTTFLIVSSDAQKFNV